MITQGDAAHPAVLNASFMGRMIKEVNWPGGIAIVEFTDGFGLSIENRDTGDVLAADGPTNLDDGPYPMGVPLDKAVYGTNAIWGTGVVLAGPTVLLKSAAAFNSLTFLVSQPVITDGELAAIVAEATTAAEGWFNFNTDFLFFVSGDDEGADHRLVHFAPSTDTHGIIAHQSFLVDFKNITKAAVVLHGLGVPPRSTPETAVSATVKISFYGDNTVFAPQDIWKILAYTDDTLINEATAGWSLEVTHSVNIPAPIDLIVFNKSGEVV